MAYQDTGKHVVAFMILALVLSFAALIALWAMGAIPTTSYPQIVNKHESPARLAITADARRPGSVRECCFTSSCVTGCGRVYGPTVAISAPNEPSRSVCFSDAYNG